MMSQFLSILSKMQFVDFVRAQESRKEKGASRWTAFPVTLQMTLTLSRKLQVLQVQQYHLQCAIMRNIFQSTLSHSHYSSLRSSRIGSSSLYESQTTSCEGCSYYQFWGGGKKKTTATFFVNQMMKKLSTEK